MNPIVIIANYRTGSNAYGSMLARDHNFIPFLEPHLRQDALKEFQTVLSSNNNDFLLKIMPDQIEAHVAYKEILSNDCYKIKMTRDDKVEQIVSLYVARQTDAWTSYNSLLREKKYSVPINPGALMNVIEYILKMDKLLDNCGIDFDQSITYESIKESLIKNGNLLGHEKLIAPINYEELKQYTNKLINERYSSTKSS